jgi:predicted dinucleotide-binding enzyme
MSKKHETFTMKTTIALIGAAGTMGSALARNISKANYRLLLFDTNTSKLAEIIRTIKSTTPNADVEAMACPKESSWEADIIIPAVPYQSQSEVAEKIRAVALNKIVISIANPLNDT